MGRVLSLVVYPNPTLCKPGNSIVKVIRTGTDLPYGRSVCARLGYKPYIVKIYCYQ
jgi:hypothetical protein